MTSGNVIKNALSRLPESIQLKWVSFIRKKIIKTKIVWIKRHLTLAWLSAITVRRWTIMQITVQSQKNKFNLDNLLVDGWS